MWSDGRNFLPNYLLRPSRSAPCSPIKPYVKNPPARSESFHALPKLPAGDSPYVKAKHAQLVDRDPNKAIPLFWAAINTGDRVDSALKDMAIAMKQVNRAEEAIEAIKSFRRICSDHTQESLDNVLLDLYKRCGRTEEQIELLKYKLEQIEESVAFSGWRTKVARFQGKKFHISIEQEKSRLLGNLGWAYMQQENFATAEAIYRKALSIEPDNNKTCNLSICLMHLGRIAEAKSLLQSIQHGSIHVHSKSDSFLKSFERAIQVLTELDPQSFPNPNKEREETKPDNGNLKPETASSPASINGNKDQGPGFSFFQNSRTWGDEVAREIGNLNLNEPNGSSLSDEANGLPVSINGNWRSGEDFSVFSSEGKWEEDITPTGLVFANSNSNSNNTLTDFSLGNQENYSREHVSLLGSINSDPKFFNGEPLGLPMSERENSKATEELIRLPVSARLGETEGQDPLGLLVFIDNKRKQRSKASLNGPGRKEGKEEESFAQENLTETTRAFGNEDSKQRREVSVLGSGKKWSEIVEEEEAFGDENLNSNIQPQLPFIVHEPQKRKWKNQSRERTVDGNQKFMAVFSGCSSGRNPNSNLNFTKSTPPRPPTRSPLGLPPQKQRLQNQTENLLRKFEMADLEEEESKTRDLAVFSPCSTGPIDRKILPGFEQKPEAQQSLSFDQRQKQDQESLDFGDLSVEIELDSNQDIGDLQMLHRNRLRVFEEITLPGSP